MNFSRGQGKQKNIFRFVWRFQLLCVPLCLLLKLYQMKRSDFFICNKSKGVIAFIKTIIKDSIVIFFPQDMVFVSRGGIYFSKDKVFFSKAEIFVSFLMSFFSKAINFFSKDRSFVSRDEVFVSKGRIFASRGGVFVSKAGIFVSKDLNKLLKYNLLQFKVRPSRSPVRQRTDWLTCREF